MPNPRLRFKKADGTDYPDWEDKKLGDILTQRREMQTISEEAPLLAFTIEDGVIDPIDKKTNKRDFLIKDKESKKFQLTKYDDIIYNPANIKFGAIHRNKFGQGVVSPIYVILTTDQNPGFLENYFKRKIFLDQTKKYLEGTVEKLRTLKPENFLSLSINLPCLEEQEKIADFLSDIDEFISLSDQEVKKLQELKKGAMQKIFSQEIRFKKADGTDYPDWEEKKLGEVFDIFVGGDIDKKNSSENYSKFYPYPIFSNSLVNNGLYGYANYYKVNYDCFTVTARGDIGVAIARHGCFVPIVRLLVCKPKNNQNVNYFSEAVNNAKIYIESTAIPQLTAPQLYNVQVKYPLSLEEQQKIGDFLSDFDEAISLAKQELEKWKLLKKGLLQQMFV